MLKAEAGLGLKKFGQGLSHTHTHLLYLVLISFLDGQLHTFNAIADMACCGIGLGRLSAGTSWLRDVLGEVEPFERVPWW